MHKKARPARDVFAFSRGGLTVIASFVAAPIIASDRINQARDEHVRRARAASHDRTQDNQDCGPGQVGAPQTA